MTELVDRHSLPNLANLTDAILVEWPKHRRYLEVNLSERRAAELQFAEILAEMVVGLSKASLGGLANLASDYRFISEKIILPEELHFRRTGAYRLKTFAQALEQVYSQSAYMTRYMNGLLVTDVIWLNHCRCMQHFREEFLPRLDAGAALLEIGPGHGLLLSLAAREPKVGPISAWDVSAASLEVSEHSMRVLSPGRPVRFAQRDIFQDDVGEHERFDAIVFSEVLEHLEFPEKAVEVLYRLCKPGGRVWVNVPANSPAPDHLYLVRHPDEAADLLRRHGFEVVDTRNFAMSGTTLERALRDQLTVSCIVVGQRPV